MEEITYVSPGGQAWCLSNRYENPAWIVRDGIEGLVGAFEEVEVHKGWGYSATRLLGTPMESTIEIVVEDSKELGAAEIARRLRSSFSAIRYGTLIVKKQDGRMFTTEVRLADAIPAPGKLYELDYGFVRLNVPLKSRHGYWSQRIETDCDVVDDETSMYSCTITNDGDFPVYPEITWRGAGNGTEHPHVGWHKLFMPITEEIAGVTGSVSSTVWLPEAPEDGYTLSCNPEENYWCVDSNGNPAREVRDKIAGQSVAAGVAPGEMKTYSMETPFTCSYDLHTIDPWKW